MGPRIAEWQFMMRRFRKNYLAVTGLAIILFFVVVAFMAPVLAPPSGSNPFLIPQDINLATLASTIPTPPTSKHIWGTISEQYDLYYACIWGTITAFRIGVLVVAVSLVVGLLVGVVAAYYGGVADEVLMRFTDIIMAFPGLILAMALYDALSSFSLNISLVVLAISVAFIFALLAFKPDRRLLTAGMLVLIFSMLSTLYFPLSFGGTLDGLTRVMISIAIVGWPAYARIIRGEVLRVKNEDYVEASKASGSSDFRVITKHILPNSIYPVLIVATLDIGSVVLTAAALSFIGLGAPISYADWGQVISRARDWLTNANYVVRFDYTYLIPGMFISFFVVGWNLLGDGLRDILDPMLRRR